jgi:hypothetical protein
MSVALFINEQYIKDNSPINGNVDDKYIRSTIILCQKVYILPILGTALYNEISTQINSGNVNQDNTTLLNDYLVDVLLYYVLCEGIALFTYKIENKSVVKKNSENSSPIDSEEVAMLRDMYKDKAEYFAERTTKYLRANATLTKFANYLDAGSDIDTIHPNNGNYTTGWVFDDKVNIKGIDIYPSERDFLRYYKK